MKYKMAANQALKRFSRQIIKEDASTQRGPMVASTGTPDFLAVSQAAERPHADRMCQPLDTIGNRQPKGVDQHVPFASLTRLSASKPRAPPRSVVLTDWPSMITTDGQAARPA
jgi:hypothetical protein